MEIERKWLVAGWPEGAVPSHTYRMDQGYIALSPTVRIRREAEGETVRHVLCFKGKADAAGLAREEIETEIAPDLFSRLEGLIGLPLIRKEQRRYPLEGGLVLEVNQVDQGSRAPSSTPRWSSPPGRPPWPGSRASGPDTCPGRSPDSRGRAWRPTGWPPGDTPAGSTHRPGWKNKG